MQKAVLLSVGIWLFAACLAGAEDKKLGATFDLMYMSKYMTKGTEGYGQQGGLWETVKFDLWGTGLGVGVGHQGATSSGYVDKQRLNHMVYYANTLFDGTPFKTEYKLNWIYKHYYGRARNIGNTQNWIFAFSWPEILPVKNLAPYYIADYEHPAGSGYVNRRISGFVHVFGLGYDLTVPELPNPLRLSGDISYRDGYGGGAVDHDWSHVTLGISTKLDINKNTSFHPGVYHQLSMDDSVAKGDVTYAVLSLRHKFK